MLKRIISLMKAFCSFLTICLLRVKKWFLRKSTHLTELQRIIYGELLGYRRISQVEVAMERSRNPGVLKQLKEIEGALNDGRLLSKGTRHSLMVQCAVGIATAKGISIRPHSKFVNGMSECLEVIASYKYLNIRLEILRNTAFNAENAEHEEMLLDIWENLKSPDVLSGRKSRQWQELGFQGTDPATDFRGAGVLGLEALHYFTTNHPEAAEILLASSQHPMYSYPFALLSIQLTYLAWELYRDGSAKSHFYNRAGIVMSLGWKAPPNDMTKWEKDLVNILFYEFCCSLLVKFDSFWFNSKPKDIMEYGRIKSEFDRMIRKQLKDENTCFLMEVTNI